MRQLENYIGGKSVAPRSGRYADIIDPSTGEAFVQAPLSGRDDIGNDMSVLAIEEYTRVKHVMSAVRPR